MVFSELVQGGIYYPIAETKALFEIKGNDFCNKLEIKMRQRILAYFNSKTIQEIVISDHCLLAVVLDKCSMIPHLLMNDLRNFSVQ